MPEMDYVWLPREDILHFEEMETLVGVLTSLGVDKVRLTGGEPLLRRDLHDKFSLGHVEHAQRVPRRRGVDDDQVVTAAAADGGEFQQRGNLVDTGERQAQQPRDVVAIEPGAAQRDSLERILSSFAVSSADTRRAALKDGRKHQAKDRRDQLIAEKEAREHHQH